MCMASGSTGRDDPNHIIVDPPQETTPDPVDPIGGDGGGGDEEEEEGDLKGGLGANKPTPTAAPAGSGGSRQGRDNARRRKDGRPPSMRRETGITM